MNDRGVDDSRQGGERFAALRASARYPQVRDERPVVVFCAPADAHVVRGGADLPASATMYDDWSRFVEAAALAECAVVVLRYLAAPNSLDRLRALRVRAPATGVVLVTRADSENLVHLAGIPVHVIVADTRVQRELDAAIGSARANGCFESVARAVERAAELPERLRKVIARAFRVAGAAPTVSGLADAAGVTPTTLSREWRACVKAEHRLEDLLDWRLLLRATALRRPGSSWMSIAARLGVHEHTLRRVAMRLAGRRLRGFDVTYWPELVDEFERQFAEVLHLGRQHSRRRSRHGRQEMHVSDMFCCRPIRLDRVTWPPSLRPSRRSCRHRRRCMAPMANPLKVRLLARVPVPALEQLRRCGGSQWHVAEAGPL